MSPQGTVPIFYPTMDDIKNFTLKELEQMLKGWRVPAFHARQIFAWLYKRGVNDFERMSDLPEALRLRLKEGFYIVSFRSAEESRSSDGTRKFLLRLKDNNSIETVIIPAKKRATGCVSTQVGCKFACSFCASGILGFKRDLTCAEIIEEALFLKGEAEDNRLTHLVFMGTGEPLDNYDNVLKAARIINSPEGLQIGARHITISTCGVIPGIKKLAEEGLQVELSISLHAADNKLRSRILPVNKKYPLKELIAACRNYIEETGRQITFEYVLIKGLNSDLQNAQKLSILLKGLKPVKVNLIPSNFIKELKVEPPPKKEILAFKSHLLARGITATVRGARGEDIEAACGQLRFRYEKK